MRSLRRVRCGCCGQWRTMPSGAAFRRARQWVGLTLREAGSEIGVTFSHVCDIEHDRRALVGPALRWYLIRCARRAVEKSCQ